MSFIDITSFIFSANITNNLLGYKPSTDVNFTLNEFLLTCFHFTCEFTAYYKLKEKYSCSYLSNNIPEKLLYSTLLFFGIRLSCISGMLTYYKLKKFIF